MILLLGQTRDAELCYVRGVLESKGFSCYILDTTRLGRDLHLWLRLDRDKGHELAVYDNGRVLSNFGAAYWRYVGIPGGLDWKAARNMESLVHSWVELLADDIRFMNPPECYRHHALKPMQFCELSLVNDLLHVHFPETAWNTLFLAEDRDQYNSFIVKPALGGGDVLNAVELEQDAWALTVQKRIKGKTWRVFIVGDSAFGYVIDHATLDYRLDPNATVKRMPLSPDLTAELKQIASCTRHRICGIDLIEDEHGKFHFLEINPAPMWIGFDVAIGDAIAESLIRDTEAHGE